MALIIEDGTSVSGANSYITVAEARDFVDLRNLILPASDADVEVLIIKAFDYLETLDFKGEYANPPQDASFPRKNLYIQGILFSDSQIPHKLKQAQCQLAFEATNFDLQPTGDGREVLKEKVDVIEVEYAEKGISVARPSFTKVNGFLRDLVKAGSGLLSLSSIRI